MAAPSLMLIHGAWTAGWIWAGVQAELARRGISSHAPDLPGRGASTLPLGDLETDSDHLSALLEEVDGDVVLVGHSYGGSVISKAAMSASGVAHLVYVTGFCLEADEAFVSLRRSISDDSRMAEATYRSADGLSALIDPAVAIDVLFQLAPAEVAADAVARLEPQLLTTFWQTVGGTPWRDLPATYIRCTADRAIPVDVQDVMAQRCASIESIAADHHPHLSAIGPLVDVLERIARD
jgi:pimeloyl-ACP methyl ester carboxylesterase